MTEKQWKIIDEEFISYYGGCAYLISNGDCKFHVWERKEDVEKVCDKLNSILDENEQLKQDNVHLKVLLDSLQDKYGGLLKLVHGFDENDW